MNTLTPGRYRVPKFDLNFDYKTDNIVRFWGRTKRFLDKCGDRTRVLICKLRAKLLETRRNPNNINAKTYMFGKPEAHLVPFPVFEG